MPPPYSTAILRVSSITNLFLLWCTQADLALGSLLRSTWYQLATRGSVESPWQPVNATWEPATQMGPLTTVLVDARSGAGNHLAHVGWRAEACASLKSNGFGQRWWWVN